MYLIMYAYIYIIYVCVYNMLKCLYINEMNDSNVTSNLNMEN